MATTSIGTSSCNSRLTWARSLSMAWMESDRRSPPTEPCESSDPKLAHDLSEIDEGTETSPMDAGVAFREGGAKLLNTEGTG